MTSGKTAGDGVKTAARLRDQDIGVAARTLTHWRVLRKNSARRAALIRATRRLTANAQSPTFAALHFYRPRKDRHA
jgi:hypothetical protein